MNNIPQEIKDFSESADLFDICEKIGKDNNLMIDQIGNLDAQVRAVLRGFVHSKDFTKKIEVAVEIDTKLASKITEEINKQVFQLIKIKMQESTPPNTSNSDLEKIGGFTIEEESAPLHHPEPETHTEPLVDHLLSRPTYIPQEKVSVAPVVQVPPTAPVKPVEAIKKPSGPDLYREPIE